MKKRKIRSVKQALGSITMNKASGVDGIPAEIFHILKFLLLKCCTQYARKFGKLSSGHRTGKVNLYSNPKKGYERMFKIRHNCTHLTHQQSNAQDSPSQASIVHEPRTSRCSSWI